MGNEVGLVVDGAKLGFSVGNRDGWFVDGACVGLNEGSDVIGAEVDGAKLGLSVGNRDGLLVDGACVGLSEGSDVVGASVGIGDGSGVSMLSVGDSESGVEVVFVSPVCIVCTMVANSETCVVVN